MKRTVGIPISVIGEKEQKYVISQGINILSLHTTDFIPKRSAPTYPRFDAHLTPTKGHPSFITQCTCGCNDRETVGAFFSFRQERDLIAHEVALIVEAPSGWNSGVTR